jgi:hypothetical protein
VRVSYFAVCCLLMSFLDITAVSEIREKLVLMLGMLHHCCEDVCITFEGILFVHRLFNAGQQIFYANPIADTRCERASWAGTIRLCVTGVGWLKCVF